METKSDSSGERATIIAEAALSAIKKLDTEKKILSIGELASVIQFDPRMADILGLSTGLGQFQKDEILRQKKQIEDLKGQLQENITKRRAMIAQLDVAERQAVKINEFMFRAFPVLLKYVNAGENKQLKNTFSQIQGLLLKKAALHELDAAFQQLKDFALKEELETGKETEPAAESPDEASFKHPAHKPESLLNRFKKKYLKLVDHLKFYLDQAGLKDIAVIEQRLRSAIEAYDLLDIQQRLRDLLKAFVHRTGLERDQMAGFILEVGERLVEMERLFCLYTASLQKTGEAGTAFTAAIENEMTRIQDAVDVTKNLEELKSKVLGSIGLIKEAIEKKRKDEWEQAQKADEEMSSLNKSIERMKLEIASAKKRNKRLETEILMDPLTQIHSRRAYELRVEEEMKRYHQDRRAFSLLLLDVDNFKDINDRYGHPVGDGCLKGIVKRIRPLLKDVDFLSRFEGDEFVVVLPGSGVAAAGMVAEKIRAYIAKTAFLHKGEHVKVTISIGIAEAGPEDKSAAALFGRAEKALYRAKEAGRNRVVSG